MRAEVVIVCGSKVNPDAHPGRLVIVDRIAVFEYEAGRRVVQDGATGVRLAGDVVIDPVDMFGDARSGPRLPVGSADLTRERREWKCRLCSASVTITAENVLRIYDLSRATSIHDVDLQDVAATLAMLGKGERRRPSL